MRTILLVNPNSSPATTRMMVETARAHLAPETAIRGVTAARGPSMIVNEAALAACVPEVVRMASEEGASADAVIVAAFGDPGLDEVRRRLRVPVVGIGEAAIREAASDGRRFGIATTTPALAGAIERRTATLGLAGLFTGLRLPEADPLALATDPVRQDEELAKAVSLCIETDGAEAVVIGGGPLSATASRLRARWGRAIIEPVPAAVRSLL